MGTSLPFLVRGMVAELRTAGRTIGLLYGINLLGAACGAALTPWVLIRLFGIRDAVLVRRRRQRARRACSAWPRAGSSCARRGADEDRTRAEADGRVRRRAIASACGSPSTRLSGFCALALEILWFRVLEMAVKSTAFTFGTVLALYLLGAAAGLPRSARRWWPACGTRCGPSSSCSASCSRTRGSPSRCSCRCRRTLPATRGTCATGARAGSAWAATWEPAAVLAPVRPAAVRDLRAAHGAHGPVVPDPPARGARRPAHQRPQGRPAAGREHRRLRGRAACSSASSPSIASAPPAPSAR